MITSSVEYFKSHKYIIPGRFNSPIIIAWKLRTPENYGNLLRIADTVGCSKVIFVESGEELAHRKIRKTARDSYQSMPFEFVNEKDFIDCIPENYSLWALETAERSVNIYNTVLPDNMALVVGNEKTGIKPAVLELCEQIVHIPLTGNCTSLNVSHATAIAVFEWLRQKVFSI